MKCNLLGCEYEAAGDRHFAKRALENHLAVSHGIGESRAAAHFGCMFPGCNFEVAGTREFTADATKRHLVEIHEVDPARPETLPFARRKA